LEVSGRADQGTGLGEDHDFFLALLPCFLLTEDRVGGLRMMYMHV